MLSLIDVERIQHIRAIRNMPVILGCDLRRSEAVGLDLNDVVTHERVLRMLG